ncbi:putative siderophore transport system permease protein YfhA [Paenibacillus konkukensis]|uniref:Siderophore transport system permease protein YfhA n=1 Tax=Paenibacillus konkukensis TaxID=2020716 RepID=A0ABY4RTF6_9BACL|nr:putative siderophore transport system permease protein YfhA [Paenibacillus konkukensis]
MNFQQLVAVIPVFERIETLRASATIESPPDTHVLIVVLRGHVTIASRGREPSVFTQGYACRPDYGPHTVQVPKTKEAEYAVIFYRVLPENSEWSLHGPQYHRDWLIPLAALIGADLMLLGDCLGRILIIPREVPVGVMTAVIGAPYFVYLLRRERMRRLR